MRHEVGAEVSRRMIGLDTVIGSRSNILRCPSEQTTLHPLSSSTTCFLSHTPAQNTYKATEGIAAIVSTRNDDQKP